MGKVLQKRSELSEIKNEYEALIYKVSNDLENDPLFKRMSSDSEKANVAKVALEQKSWFFANEFVPIKRREFRDRISQIKDSIQKIDMRKTEFSKRAPAFHLLNKTLIQVFQSLNKTWPKEKPWIPVEKIEKMQELYNSTLVWFEENFYKQKNLRDDEDPIVKTWEIDWKKQTLEHRFSSTNRTPKPTPIPLPKVVSNQSVINQSDINQTEINQSEINQTLLDQISLDSQNETLVKALLSDENSTEFKNLMKDVRNGATSDSTKKESKNSQPDSTKKKSKNHKSDL